MSHRVIFGLAGQELRHVTPARVASATFQILDLGKAQDDTDRVLASGPATSPAWSLSLDDPAGPDQADGKRVPVTLTAGPTLGEAVVITDALGSFEGFTVEGIAVDDALRSKSFIGRGYPAGSTVQSATLTAPVDIAVYNFEDALVDGRDLGVQWVYTLGAGEARVMEPLELTRQTEAVASAGPALELVKTGWPELAMTVLQGLTLEGLAMYSLEQIEADLGARESDVADLVMGQQGKMLLVAKILHEAAERGYAPGTRDAREFLDGRETEYSTKLEQIAIGHPGREAFELDSEAVSNGRTTYRSPLGPM